MELKTPVNLWSPYFPHEEFQQQIKVRAEDPEEFVEWDYKENGEPTQVEMLDEETGDYYIEYIRHAPKYFGQVKNGARHGKGRMTWPNGNVFDGHWENGRANGYGELSINDEKDLEKFGNRYLGMWKNDLKHGPVKKIITHGRKKGQIQEGVYSADKCHGLCFTTFADGGTEIVEYVDNKKQGFGIHTWITPSGTVKVFQGEYHKNRKSGMGVLTTSKGEVYRGNYIKGDKYGLGMHRKPGEDKFTYVLHEKDKRIHSFSPVEIYDIKKGCEEYKKLFKHPKSIDIFVPSAFSTDHSKHRCPADAKSCSYDPSFPFHEYFGTQKVFDAIQVQCQEVEARTRNVRRSIQASIDEFSAVSFDLPEPVIRGRRVQRHGVVRGAGHTTCHSGEHQRRSRWPRAPRRRRR